MFDRAPWMFKPAQRIVQKTGLSWPFLPPSSKMHCTHRRIHCTPNRSPCQPGATPRRARGMWPRGVVSPFLYGRDDDFFLATDLVIHQKPHLPAPPVFVPKGRRSAAPLSLSDSVRTVALQPEAKYDLLRKISEPPGSSRRCDPRLAPPGQARRLAGQYPNRQNRPWPTTPPKPMPPTPRP